MQLESGYTYVHDRAADVQVDSHVLPEALFRVGLTDYLELRIAWVGYVFQRETDLASGAFDHTDGASDLDLGFKWEVTEECGWRPESAIIVSCTAPTGHPQVTSNQVDTVVNYCYGWELSEEFALGCSTGNLWTRRRCRRPVYDYVPVGGARHGTFRKERHPMSNGSFFVPTVRATTVRSTTSTPA